MKVRELSHAQTNQLDALARTDPDARVVGWLDPAPLVRRGNGKHVRIMPTGRINAVRPERVP